MRFRLTERPISFDVDPRFTDEPIDVLWFDFQYDIVLDRVHQINPPIIPFQDYEALYKHITSYIKDEAIGEDYKVELIAISEPDLTYSPSQTTAFVEQSLGFRIPMTCTQMDTEIISTTLLDCIDSMIIDYLNLSKIGFSFESVYVELLGTHNGVEDSKQEFIKENNSWWYKE